MTTELQVISTQEEIPQAKGVQLLLALEGEANREIIKAIKGIKEEFKEIAKKKIF